MSKRFATHLAVEVLLIAAVATLSFASASNFSDVYEYFQVISGPAAAENTIASPVERPRNNPNLLVGLSGTYNIPGDFPDLATAIASLNSNGVTGPVTLNVTAPQTSPANSGTTGGGYIIGGTGSLALTTTSATNTVTIQGNGNTVTAPTSLVAGRLNDAIFKLVGADWVTITGFTMQENAANTATTPASNNMIEWGVALLYVTTTDGAQNDTIQNNTIILNRAYANTFGIYSNSTHTATDVVNTVSATGAAGGSSGLKIYGNSISNVNMGVVVVGPQAASDVNTSVDIGGAGGVQANSITNFGTTNAISGYANVSATVNGILVRNSNGFNISYNTITSSPGEAVLGVLNGIQIPAPSNAPTGTYTNSISNNSISLLSGAPASIVNGISLPSSSATSTATLNINGNNFSGFGYFTDGNAAVNFIANSSNYRTQSISNNTFTNNSVNTAGAVTLIQNNTTLPTGGSKNVNGNTIVTGFSKPTAGSSLTLFSDSGTDAAGTTNNTNNNNFSNITVTGATALNGILNSNASPNKSVSNNTISNINAGSSAVQAISVTLDTGTTAVSGNTVSGFTVAGGTITGIVCGSGSGASTLNCSQNTVQGLSSAGGSVVGMSVVGATVSSTRNIFKNKVYNDQSTTGSNYGIQVLSATTVNLYNNLIGDLRVPQGNTDDLIRGISANSTTANSNVNVSYNTVFLNASSNGATFGSSAIFHSASSTATTGTLNLRNNILVNNSTQNGAGIAAVYRRSNTPLNNFGSVSNNNLFFISSPGTSRYFFYNSSVGDTSLSAYKARVTPTDSASVTENPIFVSTNGGDAGFLHISTSMVTQIESGGTPIAGITDDFDGDSRNASTPDIGADEFVGAGSDNTPPGISYTALSDTSSLLNPTLGVSMTDATGVASGANLPRVYFKKSTDGAYASSQCSFSSGNSQNGTYLCTVNYALVGGGSVSAGNTVQYFVAAQDTLGNFTTNPIGGTGNVNAVAFGGSPNSYVIKPLISGNKNVGAGGDYPTITAALTALTNADLGGPLTLTLTDASYGSETFPLTVNANPGSSATNTITIKPASGVSVSITGNNTGCILNLSGADWVTLDGSNNGTTTRNLTLANSSTNSNSAVVCLNSLGVGQGATNDTIKNVNIVGFGTTATPATLFGIYAGAGTIGKSAAGPDNDNNTFQNNNITKTSIGIYSGGESAANKNTGTVINQNVMNSASPNNLMEGGILVRFDDGAQITQNDISVLRNDGSVTASGLTNTAFGIALGLIPSNTVSNFTGSDVTNASITRNKINGIVQLYSDSTPDGYSAFGLVVNTVNSGTTLIANNMISGVRSAATVSDFSAGIVAGGGTGSTTQIYFNSVSMTGSRTGGDFPSYALAIGGGDPTVDVRDNIFLNTQTGTSTGKMYAIGTASSTFTNLTSDFNDLFTSGANTFVGQTGGLGVFGTDRTTFANWTAATGKDASSVNSDPLFTSATDLHLQAGSPDIDTGTAIAGITTDYDGNVRPAGAAVDRGADEVGGTPGISVTGGPLNFGNQLVGTTSGDMSLTVTNTGTGDLVMGLATLTTGASQYVITANPNGAVVPPGQTTTVSIAFKPTTRGIKAGTVTINSNAPVTVPQVSLSGTGVAPVIGLSTGSLSFGSQTVGTTSSTMALTISNNGDTGQNLSINSLSISGTNATDFNITDAPSLPALIAAGGQITIHVTFTPGAAGARSATLTVGNNDPLNAAPTVSLGGTGTVVPGTIALSSATYSVSEGVGTATITASRTGGSNGAVGISYSTSNGTATAGTCGSAGADYQSSSGTLSWGDGDVASKTFNITVCDDALFEPNETVNIAITTPTGGATLGTPNTAVLTINENDTAFDVSSVTPADSAVNVARSTPISVLFNRAANPATITTTSTTACVGSLQLSSASDNFATCVPLGTPVGSVGNTTFTVTPVSPLASTTIYKIRITTTAQDTNGNPLIAQSTQGNGFTTASAGTLALSSATYTVSENGGTATITVNRTGGTDGAVGVSYSTSNGTATGGASCVGSADYVTTSGTLSWTDGQTGAKTFTVPICDDVTDEANETVNLAITSPTGGATLGAQNTAVLTINDNDPTPAISISDVTMAEGNSGTTSFVFNVTLSNASSGTITVDATTANGTATAPGDYTAISSPQTITFNPGDTIKTVSISVNGDTTVEPDETFFVNLANASVNASISDNQGQGTITNDDVSLQLNSATYSAGEGAGTATITVTRAGTSVGAVGISYATSSGTATGGGSCGGSVDYVAASGTLSWASGDAASKTFNITICDDSVFEGNENLNITLSSPTGGASMGSPSAAVLTILDNDSAQPMATNLSAAETYTEDTSLNLIDIVVSDADSATVTATLTLSNSTAGSLTTGTSNAVTSTYNAATGVWSSSGAIADVNVLLAGVTFVPAANFNANFTIATSVTDGTTAPVTGTKPMTGTPVNDAPVLDASKTPVLAAELEDSPAPAGAVGTLVSGLVDFAVPSGQVDNVTDVDSGAVLGVAAVATNTTSGVWFYSIDNGTTWNAVGAVSDSNARLLAADANTRIYFQPNANFNGTIANAITFRAWDQTSGANGGLASAVSNGGTTPFSVATDTAGLTVTPVNDPPTASNLSAAETYTEDTPLNLIDIVASDIDSANVTATLTLSNTAAGSLSTATSNAVTSVYNGATGVWTASGAIADVNVLLAGVTFNPAANFNSNFSIATNISDGSLSVSGSKAMTGTAVNDPPTATNLSAAESYTEDAPLNLIDIVVSDVDSPSVTATLTLSNTTAGSLSTGTSGAVTSTYNAATGVWTASGAIANVNTLLAGIVFTPAANFNSNFSVATSISDGVAAPITGSKAMTGVAVNDPPTASNLSASETYTEDTSLNLIDIVVSDVDNNTTTATLTLSNTAAGSLTTATSGSVTSTYNSATGVWTASGAISDVNVLLAGVTFVPAANFNSNFSIATSVSDGIAAPITGTKSMTGIAVNDAPVLDVTKSPTFVPESQDSPAPTGAVGTLVSNLVDFASPAGQVDNVTDVDAGAFLGIAVIGADTTNGAWFYSTNGGTTWIALATVSDASARLLAADANTRLYFQPNAGFNGTIASGITFRAWDQTSGTNGSLSAAVPNGGVAAFSSASDTASITINAVSSGTMQFSSAAYAGNEGASVTVTVNRSTSSGSATIHYATSDGTATAGTCGSGSADYAAVSGNLTFNAGETIKTFVVSLCSDSISETPAETINLTLTGAVGAQSTAVISIYDAATQFVNNTPLNFSGGTAAVSSQITTSGTTLVSGVRVTLFGVTAPNADNIDILLVAPNGAKYVLMGDVGGVNSLSNQTITIEDVATTFMPDSTAITPGVNYRPTTCGGAEHDFAGGAPAGPYSQPGCGPLFTTTLGSVFGNVTPNGTWTLYARDDNGVDPFGATNSISGWGIQLLAPTAAPVSISGQLLTSSGQGIRNATVRIWGGVLPAPVTVKTGTFGYYTFEGLQPGTTYIISVDVKKFVVGNPTRAVTVFDNVAGFDFIAEPQE
jgi:hypothetical protein